MIQIYSAPLEGITGFAYRNAHRAHFTGIEKYYTPFLAPNYTHHLKTREREDIAPANNIGIPLVPQILTNRPGDFLWAAGQIYDLGYREINLNLGCPMPTVVKKHRGSGQLGNLDELDRFLNEICEGMDRQFGLETGGSDCSRLQNPDKPGQENGDQGKLRFSVKTRIGLDDADDAAALLELYNRYPLSELIVHPRTQKDLYGGKPDLETFAMFLEECRHPVVYNGDIFSVQDFVRIRDRFPDCERVMLGRGLIADPALARETGGGARLEKEELRKFHDAVFEALRETLPGQAPLIGKMKELWFYMGRNFEGADRYLKDIRKAKDLVRYRAAVRTLFSQCIFKD